MKVIIETYTEEAIDSRDYCDTVVVSIDGKQVFSVGDGEPEDNNLSRNFSDCYNIDNLMKRAYEAGKKGEKFELEYGDLDES